MASAPPSWSDREEASLDSPRQRHRSDSVTSSESEISTLAYSQEPFETFQSRALALAHSTVWPDAALDELGVERLLGGGYNRIIGLARKLDGDDEAKVQYILQIPRFRYLDSRTEGNVAVLRFVREYTKIPVPTVISFDTTAVNEL